MLSKAFKSVVMLMLNVTTMNVVAPFLTAVASQVKLVPRFLVENPFSRHRFKKRRADQDGGSSCVDEVVFRADGFQPKDMEQ